MIRHILETELTVTAAERLEDSEAFGCSPIRVTLESYKQVQDVINHEDFLRVGTIDD